MEISETKETILRAAEKLFAQNGYHGTSIRAITNEAGVNLASVNYHFGSKEALVEALFQYRFDPINRMRVERMNEVLEKAGSNKPEVRAVLAAFITPVFECDLECCDMSNLSALIHMAHSGTDMEIAKMLVNTFRPVLELLYKSLGAAMPDVDENILRWKTHFMIGGFTHTIRIAVMQGKGLNVPKMPAGLDRRKLIDMMVAYFTAGMEAR